MNDDSLTTDGKISNDEKSSGLGKLESMSKEELIKIIRNQILLKKKLDSKINELTESNANLQELRNETNQQKIHESQLEEELTNLRQSFESLQFENETLKLSCQTCQDRISTLQNELSVLRSSLITERQKSSSHSELLSNSISSIIDLFQLSLSLPDLIDNQFFEIFKNELEQKQDNYKQIFEHLEREKLDCQQRLEDLEFFSEEIKLENEDLRLKIRKYLDEKQLFEKEIDNYRRQIEDFEEQFLELQRESQYRTFDTSQQQPSSRMTLHQSDENLDEIIFQCLQNVLDQIDDQNSYISKASSTSSLLLSSDIPTLLHSVGITNSSDDEFSIPLDFESVLRLCTLLIERCRVLQYILLKNNDISMNSIIDHDFNPNSISFVQNNLVEQCKISIHKQDHIVFDTIFERIYTGMNEQLRTNNWQIIIEKSFQQKTSPSIRLEFDHFKFISAQIEDNLRFECDRLSQENASLKSRLSHNSYNELKEHQTYLEEQLTAQCTKTLQLENILKQANLDKIKLDQLQQIEISYKQLQEQIEKQYHDQNELFQRLKLDYEKQRLCLLERDETIRRLRLERDEQEKLRENLIEKYQNHIKQIENNLEKQRNSLINAAENQDQRYSILSQQQDHFQDLIAKKIQENEHLFDKNFQLENDLKISRLQIENLQHENEEFRKNFNQSNPNDESTENIQELKEKYHKMKILLTRLKKEFQEKNQQQKQNLMDLELADYEKTIDNLKKDLINKDKDLQELRDELLNTNEKYSCLKIELENLEEQKCQTDQRANKFKALLDHAKNELQNAKDREMQRFQNDDQLNELIQSLQNQLELNQKMIKDLNFEKQQLIDKFDQQNKNNEKTIQLLEQNLRIAKHDLDLAKTDYDTLQDDFNSYKIRAQSVLKQHQINHREQIPLLADKQIEFDQTIEKYRATLENANNRILLLVAENETLQKELERLINIQTNSINEGKKREQDLRKQNQIEIDKLEMNYSQQINECQDQIKNLTVQNETITIAFKEQIATIESDHQQAIGNLKNQLELYERVVVQLKNQLELLEQRYSDQEKYISNIVLSSLSVVEQQQQAESEDQTPETIQVNSTDTMETNHLNSSFNLNEKQDVENELNRTKTQLFELTELFNESELNNQRLTEQITLLKDEIRRLERNMDRAESISNLEYLKNIILKFFILKSSPERLQLIPVLVTMLKLSPDEQEQLVRVANISTLVDDNSRSEQSPSQQIPNGANSPSWSSYLNIW